MTPTEQLAARRARKRRIRQLDPYVPRATPTAPKDRLQPQDARHNHYGFPCLVIDCSAPRQW